MIQPALILLLLLGAIGARFWMVRRFGWDWSDAFLLPLFILCIAAQAWSWWQGGGGHPPDVPSMPGMSP